MDNIAGRGFKSDSHDSGISTEFKSLGSLMELSKIQSNNDTSKSVEDSDVSSQVIYEEENSHLLKLFLWMDRLEKLSLRCLMGRFLR